MSHIIRQLTTIFGSVMASTENKSARKTSQQVRQFAQRTGLVRQFEVRESAANFQPVVHWITQMIKQEAQVNIPRRLTDTHQAAVPVVLSRSSPLPAEIRPRSQ